VHRLIDARAFRVVQQDVIARQRTYMRDACAHLACADDADRPNVVHNVSGHKPAPPPATIKCLARERASPCCTATTVLRINASRKGARRYLSPLASPVYGEEKLRARPWSARPSAPARRSCNR